MEAFSKLSWLLCEGQRERERERDSAFLNDSDLVFACLALCDDATLPLVTPVLVSAESSGQVEGAVGSQAGVHPLREMEDLWGRERLPLPLFSLQPTLAATVRALLPAPEMGRSSSAQGFCNVWQLEVEGYLWPPFLQPYLLRPSFLARSRLDRSCRQQMRKDRDMARMTMPLTTEANTATLRPRSSGLGMAVGWGEKI